MARLHILRATVSALLASWLLAPALFTGGCSSVKAPVPSSDEPATPRGNKAPGAAFVHLFEYYFFEVIDQGNEAISARDYLDVAGTSGSSVDITEFKYARINDSFLNRNGKTLSNLADLSESSWSLLPSERAVVFTNNHDTQRATRYSIKTALFTISRTSSCSRSRTATRSSFRATRSSATPAPAAARDLPPTTWATPDRSSRMEATRRIALRPQPRHRLDNGCASIARVPS